MFLKSGSNWAISFALIYVCMSPHSHAAVPTDRIRALELTIESQINRIPRANSTEIDILISGSELIQLSIESFSGPEPFAHQHREKDGVLKLLLSFFGRFSFGLTTETQKRYFEKAISTHQDHQNNRDEKRGKAFSIGLIHFLNERRNEMNQALRSTQEKLASHSENEIQFQLRYAESLQDVLLKLDIYNHLLTQHPFHVQTLSAAITLCQASGIDSTHYASRILSINAYDLASLSDRIMVNYFQAQAAADFVALKLSSPYYLYYLPQQDFSYLAYPGMHDVLPLAPSASIEPTQNFTIETQSETESVASEHGTTSDHSEDQSEENHQEQNTETKTGRDLEHKKKVEQKIERYEEQTFPPDTQHSDPVNLQLSTEEKRELESSISSEEEEEFEKVEHDETNGGKKEKQKNRSKPPLRDPEELALELKNHPTYPLLSEAKAWISHNHIIDFKKNRLDLSKNDLKKGIHLLLTLAHLTQFDIPFEARSKYLMSARALALYLKDLPEYFECQRAARLLLQTFPVARILEDVAVFGQSESLKHHWKRLAEDLRISGEPESLKFADFAESEARFLEAMPLSPSDQERYLSSQILFKIQFSKKRGFKTTEEALQSLERFQENLVHSRTDKKKEKFARTLYRYGETLEPTLRPLFLLSASVYLLRKYPSPTYAELARTHFEELFTVAPSSKKEEKLMSAVVKNYLDVLRRYLTKKKLSLESRVRDLKDLTLHQLHSDSDLLAEDQAFDSVQDRMKLVEFMTPEKLQKSVKETLGLTLVEPETHYSQSLYLDLLLHAVSSLKMNLKCGTTLPESYQLFLSEQLELTRSNLKSPDEKNLWTIRKKIIQELFDLPELEETISTDLKKWPMPNRAQMDFEKVFSRNTKLLRTIKAQKIKSKTQGSCVVN